MVALDPRTSLTPLTASRSIEKPTWSLHSEASGGLVAHALVNANPFTIGRSSKNALTIADPTVSSHHAELVALADAFLVRDLGSTNGTFLNGNRVERHELLGDGDVLQFGAVAFDLKATTDENRETCSPCTIAKDVADDAVAFVQFEKMLNDKAVVPHFQPIVDRDGTIRAYEILGRSRLFGLETPAAMFRAATRLQSEVALSRLMRQEGIRAACSLPGNARFFVNTHPTELIEQGLVESIWALRQAYPEPRVVLEIHESAVTDVEQLRSLSDSMQELAVGIAYDDFGAGQSRLLELTDVRPEFVKFDISLIRNLHEATERRRQMVQSLVRMVLDLDIVALAEGVEKREEAAVCWDMGFQLGQGYHFGRPAAQDAWK
jgi:EAL domain-containing protein (putative c-di-GMP-specific phosphodiesterase class I)